MRTVPRIAKFAIVNFAKFAGVDAVFYRRTVLVGLATIAIATLVDVPQRALQLLAGDALPAGVVRSAMAQETTYVPALVVGLRHTYCKTRKGSVGCTFSCPEGNTEGRLYDPTVTESDWLVYQCNPDYGAPIGINFTFNAVREKRKLGDLKHLPPGLAIAFSHDSIAPIRVFGIAPNSATHAVASHRGLKVLMARDVADDAIYQYWFETTGEHFTDWSLLERLPRYAVMGLRHTGWHRTDKDRYFVLGGVTYDPVCATCPAPPGFIRVDGGDRGAPAGVGYVWYEKATGPEPAALNWGPPAGTVTAADPAPSAQPAPGQAVATLRGCFADNREAESGGRRGRDLDGAALNSPTMSTAECTDFCRARGFAFAGTQYATWCFCGNTFGRYPGQPVCNMACAGAPLEICGGPWANTVWQVVP